MKKIEPEIVTENISEVEVNNIDNKNKVIDSFNELMEGYECSTPSQTYYKPHFFEQYSAFDKSIKTVSVTSLN